MSLVIGNGNALIVHTVCQIPVFNIVDHPSYCFEVFDLYGTVLFQLDETVITCDDNNISSFHLVNQFRQHHFFKFFLDDPVYLYQTALLGMNPVITDIENEATILGRVEISSPAPSLLRAGRDLEFL